MYLTKMHISTLVGFKLMSRVVSGGRLTVTKSKALSESRGNGEVCGGLRPAGKGWGVRAGTGAAGVGAGGGCAT